MAYSVFLILSFFTNAMATTGRLIQSPIFKVSQTSQVSEKRTSISTGIKSYDVGYRSKAVVQTVGDQTFVYLFGFIECPRSKNKDCISQVDITDVFRTALRDHPENTLTIVTNLDGGDLKTAYDMRDAIKSAIAGGRKVNTYLPPGGVCTSACLPIFSASSNRFTSAQGRFGFHECSDELGSPSDEVTRKYIRVLKEDGITEDGLKSIFTEKVPPSFFHINENHFTKL